MLPLLNQVIYALYIYTWVDLSVICILVNQIINLGFQFIQTKISLLKRTTQNISILLF